MNPLRSGQGFGTQYKRVNSQGAAGAFNERQLIDSRHTIEGRRQRMIIGGGGGSNWRGEYNGTPGDYNVNDETTVSTGANAGLYECVAANPTVDPWVGGGFWVKKAGYNSLGQWQ